MTFNLLAGGIITSPPHTHTHTQGYYGVSQVPERPQLEPDRDGFDDGLFKLIS